jgi:hypothetical protein
MKKICFTIGLCTFIIVGCTEKIKKVEVVADLENVISLDSVNNYLQIDSLIPISFSDLSIANIDKVIMSDSSVFILDKEQQVVFRVSIPTKSLQKIIDFRGRAQNEYISITDIAMDNSSTLYVFDSDSRKVNLYDVNGKYQRSMPADVGSSIAISSTNDIGINTNQIGENILVVYSSSGELRYRIPYPINASDHVLEDLGSVVSYGDKFVYTTPFDFSIYINQESTNDVLAEINCGINQFDVKKLRGLDYQEYLQVLLKESRKVKMFDHLNMYDYLLFLSTDRNDQLLYDIKKNKVVVISNVESPYNLLFSSPVSVSKDGQFCVVLNNTLVCDSYFSEIKYGRTKLPQLQPKGDIENTDDNTIWLLMGTVQR